MSSRILPARSRARRDLLLDELIELFLAEGFLDFGIGELATRLRCSRSTIYLIASSKEQIVIAAVRSYFRRAAQRVEQRVADESDPGARLAAYLAAVAEELEPASEQFYADLAAFTPANEIYHENTQHAAQRVQDLVRAGLDSGAMRPVNASFVGAAVAHVMAAIQSGAIEAATGLADAHSYRALSDLVINGLERDVTS